MTVEEKAAKYDQISSKLWGFAKYGNTFQSTIAASMITILNITGPDGEAPEEA